MWKNENRAAWSAGFNCDVKEMDEADHDAGIVRYTSIKVLLMNHLEHQYRIHYKKDGVAIDVGHGCTGTAILLRTTLDENFVDPKP